jgi:hypothetical protein
MQFVKGLKALNIPRIEDLPYHTSPPVQFVYESEASLSGGTYSWSDSPTALTPSRPLLANTLYYFRHISFSADISEGDFTGNLVTVPKFQMYIKSQNNVMLFREPLQMTHFLSAWDYRLTHVTVSSTSDVFRGSFTGSLIQGASLLGKTSITLRAVISAQEIVDKNFINLFKTKYPVPMAESALGRVAEDA